MSPVLTERFRLATSGARAVESFDLDGFSYLAIPQLALDAPGTPAGMNGGDSDTDLLLLRREDVGDGEYAEYQRIPAPGGEDAEFFTIKGRAYLAVASIRSGHGPYEYETDSFVHRWNGEAFEPFQLFPGFAAKQWRHFVIGDRHFLALAQGVALPHLQERNRPSVIFEWSGGRFVPFQEIPSAWAYNWHHFTAGERTTWRTRTTSGRPCSTAGTARVSSGTRSWSRAAAEPSRRSPRPGSCSWLAPCWTRTPGCCAGKAITSNRTRC